MRILLTGATGFVGSHLLKGFLEDGHSVCIVKRGQSDTWRIRGLLGSCRAYDLDVTTVKQVYGDGGFDCVVHCATHYGRDDRGCMGNVGANLLFPLELLDHGQGCGVGWFVNTGSFLEDQLGPGRGQGGDVYMYGYALSKAQFRQWGRMFAARYGTGFVNMKLEHVYGGMDGGDKFIPYVLGECARNAPSLALSAGTQRRDFIHISDVVAAYRAVISSLEGRGPGGYVEYGVGTGRTRSLRGFVEIIHRAVHSTTRLDWGALPMKAGEPMQSRADNSGLLGLGWRPGVVETADIERQFGGGGVA